MGKGRTTVALAVRQALGTRSTVARGAAVALALSAGFPLAAQAAPGCTSPGGLVISGGTAGAQTNGGVLDCVRIDTSAVVSGDVTNSSTGVITGLTGVPAVYIDSSTVNGSVVNAGTLGTSTLDTTVLSISNTTLSGAVSNSGLIQGTAMAST